ncbi:hypothetical protein M404DRAFT_156721 [Pisolithus tinctorius Marx 270]|uniref:Uncharacterized protein n=1 Tax=Pisolithus tinctorius Marx 270 TaxID=870435 RepID=A0A0C3NTU6_PISTI|nr:hypothetical protein M404DRAFT_156721 [Pisolithus tinctorius Marx 270]
MAAGKQSIISHLQLPITPAYAFTDYHAQAQTLKHCIVDISTPPSGQLTLFNVYMALLCSCGHEMIQLLRDFNVQLFTQHPSEYLHREDKCLHKMDEETREWWEQTKMTEGIYRQIATD